MELVQTVENPLSKKSAVEENNSTFVKDEVAVENPLSKQSEENNSTTFGEDEEQDLFLTFVKKNRCKYARKLCCTCSGIALFLIVVAFICAHYVFVDMRGLDRPFIWLHLIVICTGIIIICVCIAEVLLKSRLLSFNVCFKLFEKIQGNDSTKGEESKQPFVTWFYIAFFTLDGEYYLIKMYLSENIEIVWQMYTYFSVYACALPQVFLVFILLVLIAEAALSLWSLFHLESSTVRNRQILLDIFTDVFCMGVPTMSMFLIFFVPQTIGQVLVCILVPSLLVMSKLFELWIDTIQKRHDFLRERFIAVKKRRKPRRSSVTDLTLKQAQRLPPTIRKAFILLNVLYIIAFIGILSLQFALTPSNNVCQEKHTKEIWNGCKIHVPFCNAPFSPKCNCAYIQITNYTEETLPKSFDEFDGLTKVEIIYSRLKSLSENFGYNHERLMHVDFNNNRLQSLPSSLFSAPKDLFRIQVDGNNLMNLPSSISKATELWLLSAKENNLTKIPFSSNMPQLEEVDFGYNKIKEIPNELSILPIVSYLNLVANSIESVPKSVNELKNLQSIWLFDNQIKNIEESAFCNNDKLEKIGIWNNKLDVIPECIMHLKQLSFFDIRYNKIASIDANQLSWCNNLDYCSIANNPVCGVDKDGKMCEKQCSINCPKTWLGNNYCDDELYHYSYYHEISGMYPGVDFDQRFIESLRNNESGCFTVQCGYDQGECGVV